MKAFAATFGLQGLAAFLITLLPAPIVWGQEPPSIQDITVGPGGTVTLSFVGTFGAQYVLQVASHPGAPWQAVIGAIPSGDQWKYTDATAGMVPSRFYRAGSVSDPDVSSSNVVGFERFALTPGYNLIANPLSWHGNLVGDVISPPPDGAVLKKPGYPDNHYSAGTWDDPSMTLPPNQAFRIFNPLSTVTTLMFLGEPTSAVQGQYYTYMTNDGTVTLLRYTGSEYAVTIPETLDALPVTAIGENAFAFNGLNSVTIGDHVTSIGSGAFAYCSNLAGVYFEGNAPGVGSYVFDGDAKATVYYLPGSIGWGLTFGGLPTALWFLPNPLILNNGRDFGVQTNGFAFVVSWATNVAVVVDACLDPVNPVWYPVATNALSAGWFRFNDPLWTNYPARLYRIRSQ